MNALISSAESFLSLKLSWSTKKLTVADIVESLLTVKSMLIARLPLSE